MEKARQELDAAVQGSDVQILDYIWYGGDSNYENVEMLRQTAVCRRLICCLAWVADVPVIR